MLRHQGDETVRLSVPAENISGRADDWLPDCCGFDLCGAIRLDRLQELIRACTIEQLSLRPGIYPE